MIRGKILITSTICLFTYTKLLFLFLVQQLYASRTSPAKMGGHATPGTPTVVEGIDVVVEQASVEIIVKWVKNLYRTYEIRYSPI